MAGADNCVFCKIVGGSIPSVKVYEDGKYVAIMDAFPAVKGHALVITKQHYENILAISPEMHAGLAAVVQKVAAAVFKTMNATGLKIETFAGADAGQSVPHVHYHVIPRYPNDGLEYSSGKVWWGQRKDLYAQGEAQELAERIKTNL